MAAEFGRAADSQGWGDVLHNSHPLQFAIDIVVQAVDEANAGDGLPFDVDLVEMRPHCRQNSR